MCLLLSLHTCYYSVLVLLLTDKVLGLTLLSFGSLLFLHLSTFPPGVPAPFLTLYSSLPFPTLELPALTGQTSV